jgi:hypothetical protein
MWQDTTVSEVHAASIFMLKLVSYLHGVTTENTSIYFVEFYRKRV